MKKLIILLLIAVSSIFSQNWNTAVQTSIPFTSFSVVDQFSNKDGINVLLDYYQRNWPNSDVLYLKYYLLSSSGSVIRSFQFENQAVEFASIDGDNDKIYVVYKIGNLLKTRKSINAGQSWTNIADINLGNNTCNNVDITFGKDDNALHVVWAMQDAGSDYKTYYQKLPSSNIWSLKENVTDGSLVGGFPTVSKSTDRVHVSYNTGQSWDPETNFGIANSRDKLVSTWQTSQIVQSSPMCFRERIFAGSSKLFDFNYQAHPDEYAADLYVKERSFNSTTWSSGLLLQSFSEVATIVSAANTVDGKSHIVYEGQGNITYRYYDGTTWSSENTVGDGFYIPKLSATSNDLFLVWGGWGLNNVYLRQYDAAPLAPQNFQITNSGSPSYHPVLSWNQLNEPDVRIKSNGLRVERSLEVLGQWSAWTEIAAISGESLNYTDDDIYNFTGAGNGRAKYRIRSYDDGGHFSSYSNEITIRFGTSAEKIVVLGSSSVEQYSLGHNFPNPFNPSTKISYSIKEEGLVTLKVYDVLGKEVETLVNESKPEGNYEVQFDASQLPSGMYIYSIQAGEFKESKKMLLMK